MSDGKPRGEKFERSLKTPRAVLGDALSNVRWHLQSVITQGFASGSLV
jgi:hypothetical protein